MKAFLKNYRQSPRKVRLVAGLVKGQNVSQALVELDFLAKRASAPLKKLLLGAIANAKNVGIEKDNLFIKEFRVDKGVTMKRMRPAAMGSAHRVNKRTSNVSLLLAEKVIPTPAHNTSSPTDIDGKKVKKKITTTKKEKVIK